MAYDKVVDSAQLDADLKVVADAIRTKGGTSEQLEFPSGMASAVESIETGITPTGTIEITENGTHDVTEYASANVNVASGGSVVDYLAYVNNISFANASFPDDITDIVLELPSLRGLVNFNNCKGVTSVKIISNTGASVTASGMFYQCSSIEIIDLSEYNLIFNNMKNFANGCRNLVEIKGELNVDTVYYENVFTNCLLLKEVRFKESVISNSISFYSTSVLSDESIESIINGLKDLTGETAKTLTFHEDVKANLTETQITTITSKNWTLA